MRIVPGGDGFSKILVLLFWGVKVEIIASHRLGNRPHHRHFHHLHLHQAHQFRMRFSRRKDRKKTKFFVSHAWRMDFSWLTTDSTNETMFCVVYLDAKQNNGFTKGSKNPQYSARCMQKVVHMCRQLQRCVDNHQWSSIQMQL